MKHLTVDEIIDFVSISRMDMQSMELADYVNLHICSCHECLKKVRAFQLLYDELTAVGHMGDFRAFAYKIVSDESISEHEEKAIECIDEREYKQD